MTDLWEYLLDDVWFCIKKSAAPAFSYVISWLNPKIGMKIVWLEIFETNICIWLFYAVLLAHLSRRLIGELIG